MAPSMVYNLRGRGIRVENEIGITMAQVQRPRILNNPWNMAPVYSALAAPDPEPISPDIDDGKPKIK